MKKALLASTALVGAALLSAPAQAGSVGSGDNMAVSLKGIMFFQAHVLDEEGGQEAGFGRGYDFDVPETEIAISASNTADNGIKYGVTIEMEVNTDATGNADEVYAFLSGDFGRIDLGDQDDATNRMLVGAFQAHKGASGPFGSLLGIQPVFHNADAPAGTSTFQRVLMDRTDWQPLTSTDDTKITYFSPRFSGFQVGASFTPDSGGAGASFGERDDNGSWENMIGLGANYTGKFDDFGLSVSLLYETAELEGGVNSANAPGEDLEIFYIGAKVDFAGFTVGANYRDNGDSGLTNAQTLAGADAGDYWAVAAGYQQGPWGVSGWFSLGESDTSSTVEASVQRWGIGGRYAIAPGWQIKADYNNNVVESTGATDRDSQAFILTNQFNF